MFLFSPARLHRMMDLFSVGLPAVLNWTPRVHILSSEFFPSDTWPRDCHILERQVLGMERQTDVQELLVQCYWKFNSNWIYSWLLPKSLEVTWIKLFVLVGLYSLLWSCWGRWWQYWRNPGLGNTMVMMMMIIAGNIYWTLVVY